MGQENNKISTKEYIESHISRVQKWISKFSGILFVRGLNHDKSKLIEPEFSLWKKMDEEPRYPYGTKEYQEKIERHKKVFEHHYRYNRHHPEHWYGFYSEMDLIDIIEMLCDWLGYKEDITLPEAEELVKQQCKRYKFNKTFESLIFNTLKNYFVIPTYEKEMNDFYRSLGLDKYEKEDCPKIDDTLLTPHIDILA